MKKWMLLALGAALSVAAHAEQYPTKRVSFVSGVTPGSASDTMARIIAEKLQQKWNQTVIVENRLGVRRVRQLSSLEPGAGGRRVPFICSYFSTCRRPVSLCLSRGPLDSGVEVLR